MRVIKLQSGPLGARLRLAPFLSAGILFAASFSPAEAQTSTFDGNYLPCISYNIAMAQLNGAPVKLARTTARDQIRQNEAAACSPKIQVRVRRMNTLDPANPMACVQYPFPSATLQAKEEPRAMIVPLAEAISQGGQLSRFFILNRIEDKSPYWITAVNAPQGQSLDLDVIDGTAICTGRASTTAGTQRHTGTHLPMGKQVYAGTHRASYAQVALWDAEFRTSYPTGNELPWFAARGVVVQAANNKDIRILVSLNESRSPPEGAPRLPIRLITVGNSGINVGNVPMADTAEIEISPGQYRVDIVQNGAGPSDSTEVHFILSPSSSATGN